MVMIRINSVLKFKDLPQAQKGDIGEAVVDNHLRKQGVVPYIPAFDGAHPFDRLCAFGKQKLFITEVKSKSKRKYYDDTGFDIRHYNEYKFIEQKYGLGIYVCFVDEEMGQVYGDKLRNLEKPHTHKYRNKSIDYPHKEGGIIYFYQPFMKKISDLTNAEITQLTSLTTKSAAYKQEVQHQMV